MSCEWYYAGKARKQNYSKGLDARKSALSAHESSSYLVGEHELFLLDCERPLKTEVHVSDDFVELLHMLFDQVEAFERLVTTVFDVRLRFFVLLLVLLTLQVFLFL